MQNLFQNSSNHRFTFSNTFNTECWFCNRKQKVSEKFRDGWYCQFCSQYNGFNLDGDYNQDITQIYSTHYTKPVSSVEKSRWTDSSPILCYSCSIKRRNFANRLLQFQSMTNQPNEYDLFKERLETECSLCLECEKKVKNAIKQKNRMIKQKWFGNSLSNSILTKQKSLHEPIVTFIPEIDELELLAYIYISTFTIIILISCFSGIFCYKDHNIDHLLQTLAFKDSFYKSPQDFFELTPEITSNYFCSVSTGSLLIWNFFCLMPFITLFFEILALFIFYKQTRFSFFYMICINIVFVLQMKQYKLFPITFISFSLSWELLLGISILIYFLHFKLFYWRDPFEKKIIKTKKPSTSNLSSPSINKERNSNLQLYPEGSVHSLVEGLSSLTLSQPQNTFFSSPLSRSSNNPPKDIPLIIQTDPSSKKFAWSILLLGILSIFYSSFGHIILFTFLFLICLGVVLLLRYLKVANQTFSSKLISLFLAGVFFNELKKFLLFSNLINWIFSWIPIRIELILLVVIYFIWFKEN